MSIKNKPLKIAITGAAGNLGSILTKELLKCDNIQLHLLIHKKDLAEELKKQNNITIFRTDLEKKETLYPAIKDVDIVIHFAGVLFKANPEKFLPKTNIEYFRNLLDTAIKEKESFLLAFHM